MEPAVSVILIAVAAFALPLMAVRLRVPAIVLEILFGIIVGPSVLGLFHASELLGYLAELGFLLLLFLSGFEIDFSKLERHGPGPLLVGVAGFLVTLGLSFYFANKLGHGLFVGLLLATTSVGLVVPTLRGARCTSTPLGQAILIAAVMADLLTLIGVTVFAMIYEHGVGWNLLRFPALFAGMGLLLWALRRLAWWFPERFARLFAEHDPEEMGIRTCLALMFVFVGLSILLDLETILGAFLAGTVFGLVFRNRGRLEQKLKGFSYGFLIPIFFIHVGIRFDLQALFHPGVLVGALALVGTAVLVKMLAAGVLFVQRFSPRDVLAAGVLLSARLSLVIAVAQLGSELGLLDRALEAQVVVMALVTATLSPTLFRALRPPVPEPSDRSAWQRGPGPLPET